MKKLLPTLLCLFLCASLRAADDATLLTRLNYEDRSAKPVDSSPAAKTSVELIGRAGYGRGIVDSSAIKLVEEAHLVLKNKAYQKETTALTVAFWVKASEFPSSARLVQKGNAGDEWQIEINYKGEFVWTVFGSKRLPVYTRVPETDVWVHVACTTEPTISRVYFNGKQVNTRKIETPEEIYCSRRPVILGGGMDTNGVVVYPFSGFFDDFRLYYRALSSEEIAELAKRPESSS